MKPASTCRPSAASPGPGDQRRRRAAAARSPSWARSSSSTPAATSSSTSRETVERVIEVRAARPRASSGSGEPHTVRATRPRLLSRRDDCRDAVRGRCVAARGPRVVGGRSRSPLDASSVRGDMFHRNNKFDEGVAMVAPAHPRGQVLVRPVDRGLDGHRPVRRPDPPGAGPVGVRRQARRARRVGHHLPRQRRLPVRRRRGDQGADRRALQGGHRRARAWSSRWSPPTPSATRCSRTAG